MIRQITGEIVYKGADYLVIETCGVGYKIFTTTSIASKLKTGSKETLEIYTSVRENSIDLYGFKKHQELDFFELLLGVSGIGPKSAIAILDITSVENLKSAVQADDIGYLTKVSGIGKKSAEKIVLELRDKLGALEESASYALKGHGDALEALVSLGYTKKEARDALKNISKENNDTGEKVKEALKILGGN